VIFKDDLCVEEGPGYLSIIQDQTMNFVKTSAHCGALGKAVLDNPACCCYLGNN